MKTTTVLLAAAATALTLQRGLAGDCDALTAAWVKHLHAPHRTTMVVSQPSGVTTLQFVLVDGKLYINPNGGPVWTVIALPPDAAEAQYRKSIADEEEVCHAGGSETIGGEAFDIVATHRKGAKGDFDSRIWISRSTGMLFRVEDDLPGGRRETSTYAFGEVVAPANSVPPSK
ncbi:MAG TPA: hypothetical protein VGB91_11595 [Rhizomicrobium sp.]